MPKGIVGKHEKTFLEIADEVIEENKELMDDLQARVVVLFGTCSSRNPNIDVVGPEKSNRPM